MTLEEKMRQAGEQIRDENRGYKVSFVVKVGVAEGSMDGLLVVWLNPDSDKGVGDEPGHLVVRIQDDYDREYEFGERFFENDTTIATIKQKMLDIIGTAAQIDNKRHQPEEK